MADKYPCWDCKKDVTATKNDRYRSHTDGDGEPCRNGSQPVPEHIMAAGPVEKGADPAVPVAGVDFQVCPQCDRKVKLTRLGYFEPHDQTLRGGDSCPVGGVRAKHARKTETVELPDVAEPPPSAEGLTKSATPEKEYIDWSKVGDLKHLPTGMAEDAFERLASLPDGSLTVELALDAASSASMETNSPGLTTTSTILQPATWSPEAPSTSSDAREGPAGVAPFHLAPLLSDLILQPFSHILQPAVYEKAVAVPMGDLAKELATRIKETFYAYSNRKTSDNRSAQTTLGPSEIGTPCDRRLAMALLGIPPVNPGGDGWAAFVGTCTHVGMAEIYTFADAGTGRYAVELPVFLGVPTVPRGTTDLLDRRDGTVVDWKVMGAYSLKKFKNEGPSETYRTQAHVYGLGAERSGEKIRNVAVVGLPRAGSSLDEMYVWTEKYDRKFAEAALARVERIANDVQAKRDNTGALAADTPADIMYLARQFPVGDDCRYCAFHLKGDKEMNRGCPGS